MWELEQKWLLFATRSGLASRGRRTPSPAGAGFPRPRPQQLSGSTSPPGWRWPPSCCWGGGSSVPSCPHPAFCLRKPHLFLAPGKVSWPAGRAGPGHSSLGPGGAPSLARVQEHQAHARGGRVPPFPGLPCLGCPRALSTAQARLPGSCGGTVCGRLAAHSSAMSTAGCWAQTRTPALVVPAGKGGSGAWPWAGARLSWSPGAALAHKSSRCSQSNWTFL